MNLLEFEQAARQSQFGKRRIGAARLRLVAGLSLALAGKEYGLSREEVRSVCAKIIKLKKEAA